MFRFGKIISESFRLAFNELRLNPLRSALTLMGVTIGIFLIILTQTAADWLKSSIDESIKSLGTNTVYVQKFPWTFEDDYPWWNYIKRPEIEYENYETLRDNLSTAEAVGYFHSFPDTNAKTKDLTVNGVSLYGCTYDSEEAGTIKLKNGRFFNEAESRASSVAIIGELLAEELFPAIEDPTNQYFRLKGRKFLVIGVVSADDNLFSFFNWDESIIVPYTVGAVMYSADLDCIGCKWITVKSKQEMAFDEVKDDIVGVMRGTRKLRPINDNDFSINRVSLILEQVKQTNVVLDMVSFFLGIFALLIGGFGVANIMFVSVRERTKYIGLKKALGAKKWIILSEFLIESIILCVLGCVIGLTFLWLLVFVASKAMDIDVALSLKNILLGVGISTFIGLVAGVVPAFIAANMNPVKAIRS